MPARKAQRVATLRIAREALKRGLSPVPLLPRSKRPSGGDAWNKVHVTLENLEQHFQDGENVGVLWGEVSGWAVDCDLDCDEAVIVARSLLPETLIYGRGQRPRSHYVFRAEGARGQKWTLPGGKVIVELRSNGMQSVYPGSIGPDRDQYAIDEDRKISELTPLRLTRLLSQVAGMSLLAQLYPEEGSRHDYVHAVTGALLRDGRSPKEVRTLVLAMLEAVKESDPLQRERTVENTIKHAADGRTQGWATLEGYINKEKLAKAREWLRGSVEEEFTLTIINGKAEAANSMPKPPDSLLTELIGWSHRRAHVQRDEFDLAVALACIALVSTNKYLISGFRTPLQPYFMLTAPTGGGKESAMAAVKAFARRADLSDYVFQGFQSYHSMLDQLASEPHMAIWLWDEAGRKLKSGARASSQDYQVMSWLLSLYGQAADHSPAVPGRNHAIQSIEHPFFLCFAASQPDVLVEAINEADLSTGLLNRFMLFDVGDDIGRANYSHEEVFPYRLEKGITGLKTRHPEAGTEFISLPFESRAVFNRFRDFNEQARQNSRVEHGSMWMRANQNALICAGLSAIAKGTQIEAVDADFGIALATWSTKRWIDRLSSTVVGSQPEKDAKSIENYVRNVRQYADRHHNRRYRELAAKGLMAKGLLWKLSRRLRGRDLEDQINRLITSGELGQGDEDGIHVYFWKG